MLCAQWIISCGKAIHSVVLNQLTFSFLNLSRTLVVFSPCSWFFPNTCLYLCILLYLPKLLYLNLLCLPKHLNLWPSEGVAFIPPKQYCVGTVWLICLGLLTIVKPFVFVLNAQLPRPPWLLHLFPREYSLLGWWELGDHKSPFVYSVKSEKSLLNLA